MTTAAAVGSGGGRKRFDQPFDPSSLFAWEETRVWGGGSGGTAEWASKRAKPVSAALCAGFSTTACRYASVAPPQSDSSSSRNPVCVCGGGGRLVSPLPLSHPLLLLRSMCLCLVCVCMCVRGRGRGREGESVCRVRVCERVRGRVSARECVGRVCVRE